MSEKERYARIAASVTEAHEQARARFVRRLARDQIALQQAARAAAQAASGVVTEDPRSVQELEVELRTTEREFGRRITQTIREAPQEAVRALDRAQASIGTALEDHPTDLSPSLAHARTVARATTSQAMAPDARFRSRVGPARDQVIAQVREGLAQGESIRNMAQTIARTDQTPPSVPRYVANVIQALEGATTPAELAQLAGPIRAAMRRMGSATEAQSWRTLRPQVERLANAVASGSVDKARKAVETFVQTRMKFEAARIARTEAARAANRAQIESAQKTPGVTALEWRLSDEHPVEDICDAYARADLYGLGPGRYPVDQAPALPAHPNCLCTLVPVIDAQSILRAIRREPEPPRPPPRDASIDEWLRGQSNTVQARVVGTGAAALLRQGASVISPTGEPLRLSAIRAPR